MGLGTWTQVSAQPRNWEQVMTFWGFYEIVRSGHYLIICRSTSLASISSLKDTARWVCAHGESRTRATQPLLRFQLICDRPRSHRVKKHVHEVRWNQGPSINLNYTIRPPRLAHQVDRAKNDDTPSRNPNIAQLQSSLLSALPGTSRFPGPPAQPGTPMSELRRIVDPLDNESNESHHCECVHKRGLRSSLLWGGGWNRKSNRSNACRHINYCGSPRLDECGRATTTIAMATTLCVMDSNSLSAIYMSQADSCSKLERSAFCMRGRVELRTDQSHIPSFCQPMYILLS